MKSIKKYETGRGSGEILSRNKNYFLWASMIQRCTNPNNVGYAHYGGRGITVCDRWMNSFKNFLEDMGDRPNGTTLDRINGSHGYCKENCRWADLETQANNRKSNVVLTHDGITLTAAQWSRKLNFPIHSIYRRLKMGWDSNKIFNTPVRNIKGQTK